MALQEVRNYFHTSNNRTIAKADDDNSTDVLSYSSFFSASHHNSFVNKSSSDEIQPLNGTSIKPITGTENTSFQEKTRRETDAPSHVLKLNLKSNSISYFPSSNILQYPTMTPSKKTGTSNEALVVQISNPISSSSTSYPSQHVYTTSPSTEEKKNESLASSTTIPGTEISPLPPSPPSSSRPRTSSIAAGVFCAVFGLCFLCLFIYVLRKTLPERRRKRYAMTLEDSNNKTGSHFEDEEEVTRKKMKAVSRSSSEGGTDKKKGSSKLNKNSSFSQYNYSLEDGITSDGDGEDNSYKSDGKKYDELMADFVMSDPSQNYDVDHIDVDGREVPHCPSNSTDGHNSFFSFKSNAEPDFIEDERPRVPRLKQPPKPRQNLKPIKPPEDDSKMIDHTPKSYGLHIHVASTSQDDDPCSTPAPNALNSCSTSGYVSSCTEEGSEFKIETPTPVQSNNHDKTNLLLEKYSFSDEKQDGSDDNENGVTVSSSLNNSASTSQSTSNPPFWNYNMASFISVAENTWDRPYTASHTYTLSSDSTDDWVYGKTHDASASSKDEDKSNNSTLGTVSNNLPKNVIEIQNNPLQNKKATSAYEEIIELEKKVAQKMKGEKSNIPKSITKHPKTTTRIKRSCFAPPGKLGVFIDTSKTGPVIHQVKENSPLYGVLFAGDQIIGVDDVDVKSMNAAAVTNMMTKRVDCKRKITVLSLHHFL